MSAKKHVIPQKLAKKDFLMPVPLKEGKAFHVPCVAGIVVSGITVGRGAAAVVAATHFTGFAIANRADKRIVAPEGAGPSPVSHPIQFERICHAHPGRYCPEVAPLLIVLFRFLCQLNFRLGRDHKN